MNQVSLFIFVCALLTVNHQTRAESDQSCDKWSCEFYLNDPDVARQQFTKSDHNKVWLVYFNLSTGKSESSGSGETEVLTWANSSTSPFLSFDDAFEIYSFAMLTQSVTMINMQATSEGLDPSRDCLKDLPPYCRNRTISKVLLNKVTDARGVVCFGESLSRRCCEYSGGDVKCDIEPRSGWRWIDINYLSAIVGIAGYFFFPLLLCLLPSLPDSQNGIELTAPQEPSPLSFTNVFVKCFSNKQEYCFRDAFVTFCCRITVLLGLLPSILFLYTIAFVTLKNKVFLSDFSQHDDKTFRFYYYAFAVFVAFVPLGRYSFQTQPICSVPSRSFRDNRSDHYRNFLNPPNYADCTKIAFTIARVYINSCFWNFLPLCCQETRKISKIWQIPTCIICILSPCCFIACVLYSSLIVLIFPLIIVILYPMHCALHISHNKAFVILCFLLSIFFIYIQYMIITLSAIRLTAFVTYTIIGFVLNYKVYLPLVSAVILVSNYVYQCYHTTNESYDELRQFVFEVCIEQQRQLDSSAENKVIVNHQRLRPVQPTPSQAQDVQHGERQPLLQGCRVQQEDHLATGDEIPSRKLVFTDEDDGSPLIPKRLFENIYWRLKPTGVTFCAMVTKMVALTMFVMMIVVMVLTLTPRTEFGVLTQATVTLFLGSLPQVLVIFSNSKAKKTLLVLKIKKNIQHCMMNYLENGELSAEQFLRQEQQWMNWA